MNKNRTKFENKIVDKLLKGGKYKNIIQIPRLEKIVINRGVSEARDNSKAIDISAKELALITGQKTLIVHAKKSIAAFKIREGLQIGLKATLRGKRMYDFCYKLINICLPKIRDFKGVNPKSFDGQGNYSLGIREQLIFPEVDYEKVDHVRGMDITFVTSTQHDNEAKELLEVMGMPFRKGS